MAEWRRQRGGAALRSVAIVDEAPEQQYLYPERSAGETGDYGIPHTEMVTAGNRHALWANRRRLFFKPAAGYGSKATYRGDKVTKRGWEEIAANSYVAQALVAPSERHIADANPAAILKVDVRNYAYAGAAKLLAARLYQGQTTNFRTPGGGFAPVFTNPV